MTETCGSKQQREAGLPAPSSHTASFPPWCQKVSPRPSVLCTNTLQQMTVMEMRTHLYLIQMEETDYSNGSQIK